MNYSEKQKVFSTSTYSVNSECAIPLHVFLFDKSDCTWIGIWTHCVDAIGFANNMRNIKWLGCCVWDVAGKALRYMMLLAVTIGVDCVAVFIWMKILFMTEKLQGPINHQTKISHDAAIVFVCIMLPSYHSYISITFLLLLVLYLSWLLWFRRGCKSITLHSITLYLYGHYQLPIENL